MLKHLAMYYSRYRASFSTFRVYRIRNRWSLFFAPGCVYYLRDSSWILDLLNQNKERKSESGILCHGARYIALSINRFSSFGQFKIYKVYAAILYRKSEDVKFIGLQDAGSVRRMASECTELLLHWILAFYITCVA